MLGCLAITAKAQTAPTTQSYGKVDQSDLELKACDFEKDANAEILFDKGEVVPEGAGARTILILQRHTRIKVFKDAAKSLGNIRIKYYSYMDKIVVNDIQAETINLVEGKQVVTLLDKKAIYIEKIDKWTSALVFAMPEVKAGSIIEYKYRVASQTFPTWNFQNYMPTRYSEIQVTIPNSIDFKSVPHTRQPFVKNVGDLKDLYQVRAMENIHSMPDEPFMGSRDQNLQRIDYTGINGELGTWAKIGESLIQYDDFGSDLNKSLTGSEAIIKNAKGLKSDDDKIAYLFDAVKNSFKWNGRFSYYAEDGVAKAWVKKLGNSEEINMILLNLLKKAGIKAFPLVACTKDHGKINPGNPTIFLFNDAVVYIPVDSTKHYILDASSKFNLYNLTPTNILNSFALSLNPHNKISTSAIGKESEIIFIENEDPSMQSISLNAEIKPDGKMEGSVEINNNSYSKINALGLYDIKGNKKYLDSMRSNDNNLKILSYTRENMNIDSLPLIQKINFNLTLSGSDDKYIYFNTNLFNPMGKNPFFTDERFADIDFGYRDNFSVYSVYKLPSGFKTDALPKTITVVMPDQSIVFKRTVAEDDGNILVKYVLNHRKTIYFKEDYPDIREFYKKMYDLMGEQIVLKKS